MGNTKRQIPKPISFPEPARRRALRLNVGLSQTEVAKRIGCHARAFRRFESAKDLQVTPRNRAILIKYETFLSELEKGMSNPK